MQLIRPFLLLLIAGTVRGQSAPSNQTPYVDHAVADRHVVKQPLLRYDERVSLDSAGTLWRATVLVNKAYAYEAMRERGYRNCTGEAPPISNMPNYVHILHTDSSPASVQIFCRLDLPQHGLSIASPYTQGHRTSGIFSLLENRWKIAPIYDDIYPARRYFIVWRNDLAGVIDQKGNILIPIKYEFLQLCGGVTLTTGPTWYACTRQHEFVLTLLGKKLSKVRRHSIN
jgi:hypothetical protein